MRAFVRRTGIALALIGASLLACGTASASPLPNVLFDASNAQQNFSTIYVGNQWWISTTDYGQLRVVVHDGQGFIKLQLKHGTKLLFATANYGTNLTPTFSNVAWDGKGLLPLHKLLTANDGPQYDIPLTDVYVAAYNAKLPEPSGGKGGCLAPTC